VVAKVWKEYRQRRPRRPDTSGEAFSSMHLTAQVAAEDFANHGYPRRSP
jgi:hypothetical protein